VTSALARRWQAAAPAIARSTDGSPPPLSYAQERMWFLEQYTPGTATYHMWQPLRVAGPLDVAALGVALDGLAARHESLRMRFPATVDGKPVVEVAAPAPVPLDVLAAASVDEARDLLGRAIAVPFDLAGGPLFRATLVALGPDDHVLCLGMHHIVSDGWSTELIMQELGALYDAALSGHPDGLAELRIGYGDWVRWQRSLGSTERDLAYWRERLAGVPALELPTDRPHPPEQTSSGAVHSFRIDAALTSALGAVGQAGGATPFMVLLAGFQALLGWYAGQDDFGVGVPVSGRGQPQAEGLVGLFVNTVVFRADLAGDPSFAELVERVRDGAIDTFAHQELPFERLVSELKVTRDVRRPPVFQVSFAMQNYAKAPASRLGSLAVTHFDVAGSTTRHELALYLYHEGGELAGTVTYNTDLFDAPTVARLFERYTALLRQVCAAPAAPLSTLDLLDPAEHALLRGFGDGGVLDGAPGLLTDGFDEWVARTPEAPAVDSLTYGRLDRLANGLAARLRDLGVRPDSRVGICLAQSTDSAVAVLGVLKAGGAYLPLDPEQPPARLAFLLADAGADVLLTSPDLAGLFPEYTGRVVTDVTGGESGPLPPVTSPDDLAYVIYTSGSTGQPKGVAVQHRQLVRYLDGIRARLSIVDGASYGLIQSLSFDFAVTMFYLALATGGRVHLLPRRATAQELAAHIAAERIDYLKLTPTHLAALAAEVPARDLLPRRALLLGGEASRADWTRELAGLSPAEIVNHYGPTEATVGVTTYQVRPGTDPGSVTTPIGRPLPYARVHVLDRLLRPVPVGAVGELFLGGDRLARGYLGRPELTAARFVESGAYGRLYRTGDLARWLPSGDLEFLGRRDHQVKLRGYRIELGEIEATLAALPEVTQAAVVVHGERLVAYLERAGTDLPVSELRERLGGTLPEYMLPAQAVWLDALPRMAHGKVDRAALPAPSLESGGAFVPPSGPVEETIAEVWRELLGVERVGAEDDFFALGGHSLLAIQVVSRLRDRLPSPVSAMDLFKHPTVRGLARLGTRSGPRQLLHELTRGSAPATRSLVCVPYGGASAVVYQPLADALPDGTRLYSVAVPGNDLGIAEEAQPLETVAARVTEEVLSRVSGPLVLYGHCGPGAALTVEVARRLEAAGRTLDAVFLGGIFPFARPRVASLLRFDRLRSDTVYANWLQSMGADVGALEPAQRRHLIRAMRRDAEEAEDYFTRLLGERNGAAGPADPQGGPPLRAAPLRAPIVSVIGEKDPGTDYYQERFREWGFLTSHTGLVVIDEAGHYFLKYRAAELAGIVTGEPPVADPGAPAVAGPRPSMARFLAVAAGQLVSMTGTALTEFALPIWAYLETRSLLRFALFAVAGVLPGILVAPVAGALVDRTDRRRALIGASVLAGLIQATLAVLIASGGFNYAVLYGLLAALSVALTLQRLAYISAVPQLVPKHYLGHANGVVQLATGAAQFLVPLVAVALLHSLGMLGILLLDVASYIVCVGVLLAIRFPRTMAWRRRETVLAEIKGGYHYFFRRPGLRAMLLFFVGLNAPLAAVLVLVSPLVLAIGSLADAGRVAMVSAAGAIAGGLVMAVWGGPKRHRMRGLLWAATGISAGALVAGLRPSIGLIAAGTFCLSFALVLVNGAWITIIHTKVPQRFHARVIALNQMVALSVLSLGYLLAPLASAALQPLVEPDGPLAGSVGAVIGTGAGRGTGLLYLLCALAVAVLVVVSLRVRVLARFDRDVPDAEPDDLIGLAALSHQGRLG